MPSSKFNKRLYTDITKLKLLDTDSAEVRFRLKKSPFHGDEDLDQLASEEREEYTITGQIFPKSDIYGERSYLIEMKLPKYFPMDPPEVRFLTPIYHPNVGKDGKFLHPLLKKIEKWTPMTSFVEVVKAVADRIDHPDVDSPADADVCQEYQENREEFNRKALEYVREHGLPR